jgi:hypothetical protein
VRWGSAGEGELMRSLVLQRSDIFFSARLAESPVIGIVQVL